MKPFENFDWKSFWDNSDGYTDDYTGKAPTDQEILDIEKETGYKLPESYIELIKRQNGGIPVNNVVTTDNVCINLVGIYGIDKDKEYSVCGDLGTDFWLKEWGYPSFGPVIADTISGGHDMIFLDYSECGPEGEPMVVLVDQEDDYSQEILADNFEKFIYKLESDRVITDIEEFKQLDAEKQVLALKKIRNMKGSRDMIELLEAEGLRDKMLVICGGPRITHELAQELGYDAGFGPHKYAEHVASYIITEIVKRGRI